MNVLKSIKWRPPSEHMRVEREVVVLPVLISGRGRDSLSESVSSKGFFPYTLSTCCYFCKQLPLPRMELETKKNLSCLSRKENVNI
jgi:hypothetical protein